MTESVHAVYIKEIEEFRVLKKDNFEYYPHFHTQMEIFYLEYGKEEIILDGKAFTIEAGGISVSFPNQIHSYRALEPGRAYLLIISVEDLEEYRQELTECLPVNPVMKREELPEYFPALWHALYEEHEKPKNIRCSKAIGRMLFSIAFSRLELKEGRNLTDMSAIQSVLDYIGKHYTGELSIEQVARRTGISVSSLSRIFRQKMNTTFTAYINELRVLKAQKRLRKTEKGMDEIAAECGFNSKRNFFRVFHEKCGCTPGEYRKRVKTLSE